MNGQFSGLYPGDRKYFKARKLSLNCYKLYKMTKDWLFKRSTIEHAEKIRLNLSCFGSGPVFGGVGWNFTGRCHGGRFEMFFLHICILTGLWHQRVSTQGHIPLICTTWVKKKTDAKQKQEFLSHRWSISTNTAKLLSDIYVVTSLEKVSVDKRSWSVFLGQQPQPNGKVGQCPVLDLKSVLILIIGLGHP